MAPGPTGLAEESQGRAGIEELPDLKAAGGSQPAWPLPPALNPPQLFSPRTPPFPASWFFYRAFPVGDIGLWAPERFTLGTVPSLPLSPFLYRCFYIRVLGFAVMQG